MVFRYARHTNNVKRLANFYTQILGFKIIGDFKNHDGYNGIFLSKGNEKWHLEFTESSSKKKSIPDEDDLLVFYLDNAEEFTQLKLELTAKEIELVKAKNPYWNRNGIMVIDPDGFRVVFSVKK